MIGGSMRKLLNTLYVTSPDSYLSLDGENIVILREEEQVFRIPLHNVEGIVAFGYTGASPALMGACANNNIALTFLTPNGKFLARVTGEIRGNVILRKEQYRISDDDERALGIAKNIIIGKIINSKNTLDRTARDYPLRVDVEKFRNVTQRLKSSVEAVQECKTRDELRGVEGEAAATYFSLFHDMILQQKEDFNFRGRNRRPPLDNVNALLSFVYTLLGQNIAAALETVGLDPYVGVMHTDRPGRISLALDLLEELRTVFADRFVLSLINRKMVQASGFTKKENGAVIMDDETRKIVLTQLQKKKQEVITHPFIGEKIEWGLVPYVQALLLARYIRGDLEEYPPFLWK